MLPKVSNKELVILDLLAAGRPMFGLELVDRSDNQLGRGTVYVTLARMEDKSYVRSFRKTTDGGKDYRRHYEITGEGRRALWAAQEAAAIWKGGSYVRTA